jgi:hypothetical protein
VVNIWRYSRGSAMERSSFEARHSVQRSFVSSTNAIIRMSSSLGSFGTTKGRGEALWGSKEDN